MSYAKGFSRWPVPSGLLPVMWGCSGGSIMPGLTLGLTGLYCLSVPVESGGLRPRKLSAEVLCCGVKLR